MKNVKTKRVCNFVLLSLVGLVGLMVEYGFSEDDANDSSDQSLHDGLEDRHSEVLIVGRMANVVNEIQEVYFLLEGELGTLKVYQAEKMFLGESTDKKNDTYRYYLTSVFPKKDLKAQQTVVRSTFLAISGKGANISKNILPIQNSNIWDLEAQSRDLQSYIEYDEQLHEDLRVRMATLDKIKHESGIIAGQVVDSEIVRQAANLKREVGALSYAQNDLKLRLDMLQQMITTSDNITEDAEMEVRQAELSEQLKEVAQLTARADRMNRLKKLAHANRIRRKMSIVEDFGDVDPRDLQHELSVLREDRASLEEKLKQNNQVDANN